SRPRLAAAVAAFLALPVGLVGPARAAVPARLAEPAGGAGRGFADGRVPPLPLVGEFYEYAPAIVVEGGVKHVFACANVVAGEIRDHIVHRRYVGGREVAADLALRPAEDK